jgi:hypothetical protein
MSTSIPELLKELAPHAGPITGWLSGTDDGAFEPVHLKLESSVFVGWFGSLDVTKAALSIQCHNDELHNQRRLEALFSVDAVANPFLHGNKRMLTEWVTPVFNVLGVRLDLSTQRAQAVLDIKRVQSTCTLRIVYFPRK